MPAFRFEPSARLQRFLGRELIADPNLAIAEFVKNAYDAGASQVYVDFAVDGRAREQQALVISDNGVGMSRDSFERDWMRPGYSAKARRGATVPVRPGMPPRVPIGEKGLGRLAAGRLGNRLEVFTRRSPNDPWLHVVFDWNAFTDMDVALREVEIPYDEATDPSAARFLTGTIVRIEDLGLDWTGLVPGRKVAGRSDSRVGRLRQDLQILLQPLAASHAQFTVVLACDSAALGQYMGPVVVNPPEVSDYMYSFSIEPIAHGVRVTRRVARSEYIQELTGLPADDGSVRDIIDLSGDDETERPKTLRSGEFTGEFYYSPRISKRAAELGTPPGVYVYRDGVRVDPYGHWDDDWLGVRARKASRQGYAAIQPNSLFGHVSISKQANPELVDMSNRQGLVQNDAYDDFLAHARGEFRVFEERVFSEYVQPNWELPAAKAQRAAERAQAYGEILLRNLVHSLRQPIFGLGAEMSSLRALSDHPELPSTLADEIIGIHHRASDHLHDMEAAVGEFLDFDFDVAYEATDTASIMREAAQRAAPLADSLGVSVTVANGHRRPIVVPRPLLVRAIAELTRNAIQAPRPPERDQSWVKLESQWSLGHCTIRVIDNGSGIDPNIAKSILQQPVSTQGRPGVGLLNVSQVLSLFRASVHLESTDRSGSTFAIIVPGEEELRKEG